MKDIEKRLQKLEAEAERLQKQRELLEKGIPGMLEPPVLGPLQELVQSYIEFVVSDDYHEDNDYKHYIFETAVEAFYGDGIWNWIRKVSA